MESKWDLQTVFLVSLAKTCEAFLLHCSHQLVFWAVVLTPFLLGNWSTTGWILVASLFLWVSTFKVGPGHLPHYKGPLDVLLGRYTRASTVTPPLDANNNVTIATFGGELVLAYRKAECHFASPLAKILVTKASPSNLDDWSEVWAHSTGTDDLRETLLFEFRGKLFLYFAVLAPEGFVARREEWTCTEDLKVWTKPVPCGRAGEIVWDVKVHTNRAGETRAYKASYVGNHYQANPLVSVIWEHSTDGMQWKAVGKTPEVYTGGICEVSFAFTPSGDLVAVGRNEDGDHTGFGSQLFRASRNDLGTWIPLKVSIPYRFDSPRLVLMEGELILFARYARQSYAVMPTWFPRGLQTVGNMVLYSCLPKGGAVYRIRPPDEKGGFPKEPVQLMRMLGGTYGDTGFFSLAKLDDPGSWVVANYSSTCQSHAPWFYGQVNPTNIFVCRCHVMRSDK